MPDKIKEVYERFKYNDELYSDKIKMIDNKIDLDTAIWLFEFWQAIKHHATTEICQKCMGRGRCEGFYKSRICDKCKGEGRIKIK